MMKLQFQLGTNALAASGSGPEASLQTQAGTGLFANDYKDLRFAKSPVFWGQALALESETLHWLRACTLVAAELVKKPHWERIPGRKEV